MMHADIDRPEWLKRTRCGSDDFWFDRTMVQSCDSMHYVCGLCGRMEPCGADNCPRSGQNGE